MKLGPIHVLTDAGYRRMIGEIERLWGEVETMKERLEPRHAIEIPRLAGEGRTYREPPTPPPSALAMFDVLDGWTTRFEIDGRIVGGPADLCHDPRLQWLLDAIGGVKGKRVLELGPMEGAHTGVLLDQGAREVIAIEGFRPAWLKCLVIKEIRRLDRASFLYGDFRAFAASYHGQPFDVVLASGVLYHQKNPVELIGHLGRMTRTLLVSTQVADAEFPAGGIDVEVAASGKSYRGKQQDYGARRDESRNYCGGVDGQSVWLYPEELRRALHDAGFVHLEERGVEPGPYGPWFVVAARFSGGEC
ncbi:MAG: methyltransferase domain-containing protein [Acidobacteriota bacterium]